MPPRALLLDLYQLAMARSYLAEGLHERPATFSLFTRRLPAGWGYLVAAGLESVLDYLEELAFTDGDLAELERTGLFDDGFLSYLGGMRFSGSVRALPEGTLCFPNEPVLEVSAPLAEAQIVETILINEVNFQTLVASKAARCVDVARGTLLVDFSLRRTQSPDAGLRVARSSYLAGFGATSNVLAGSLYGIPIAGTMAHSYVEAFEDELSSFRAFARSFPDRSILLVDTYDTLEGVRRAAEVGRELAAGGHRLQGVRLDSGDLVTLAHETRRILDGAGLDDAIVFASGGLDEADVEELLAAGAPIAGFGVGTRMGTSAGAPYLDFAYKLVEVDGRPTLKLSLEKATLPGPKQVWRIAAGDRFDHDVLGRAAEEPPAGGAPLLRTVMEGGRALAGEPLRAARERCARERGQLAGEHRTLAAEPYDVRISDGLGALAREVEAGARRQHAPGEPGIRAGGTAADP